ncbi:M20 family metallo-hydrolase [Rapidithrix thailandica]|uniref:M20 family metallo-hydrolase n=1 Tax=Rapidithrix thailandica TaxID=413964 RepID=A0AAW9RT46_9BACT
MGIETLIREATELLKKLIATSSLSREENLTAELINIFLKKHGVAETHTLQNNVWAFNQYFNSEKPTILLNSHHDTVKPNKDWTKDPFTPEVEEGKLFGLGSNDAGGALVSLIATFLYYYPQPDLKYNLVLAATAEEEISGQNGIAKVLPELPELAFAIVGEPTEMQLAIAEKGLMVLDCTAFGKSGHAARNQGVNAISKALPCIEWFHSFQYPKVSEIFGPIKMSVTVIQAGTQHNVIPDRCQFTVDVRTTDAYSNRETLAIIQEHLDCEVKARSTRLNPSYIDPEHPIVVAGKTLGRTTFGSPTLSDQALIPYPSLKIGPGKSERSHTANEFIFLKELEEGIDLYIQLLGKVL